MLIEHIIPEILEAYRLIEQTYSGNQIISLFFLFSFLGWVLETVYRSITNHRICNPGFLKGPIVPLYGNAGVFIMLTIVFTNDQPILIRFAIYILAITAMEFLTGEVLYRLFKKRYWDYTQNALNVRGHVCLSFSVVWGIISLVFEQTLYPLTMIVLTYFTDRQLMLINGAGILILQVDLIYSMAILYSKSTNFELKSIKERMVNGFTGIGYHQLQKGQLIIRNQIKDLNQVRENIKKIYRDRR